MNIHEYQAKQILKQYGVTVPISKLVYTTEEAVEAARNMPSNLWVVKAQVHAGGRGKAGGVKLVKDIESVKKEAEKMLGMTIVTKQTGKEGKLVRKICIEKGTDVKKEYYLSIVLDRENCGLTIIFSTEGGMDIEEVAQKMPEKIKKVVINPVFGLCNFHLNKICSKFNFDKYKSKKISKVIRSIYNAFISTDASQIEINPLVETVDGDFLALDAKFNFDDNGLFRHPDIAALRDLDEEDPGEAKASEYDLSYIKMNGEIGCMVNGAGLAMATMDIIKLYGAEPANFLDVGGGATTEKVKEAFKIILSDKSVKGILVNIFGGIMRCDIIASGIVEAATNIKINVPIVIRLSGTNSDIGKKILNDSGLKLQSADDLAAAAQKVVLAIK